MDKSYRPGDNFFMYCNGSWYNKTDLGGLEMAHSAYVAKLQSEGYKDDELIKQEKKFFQSYAELWCSKYTVENVLALQYDEHSLNKERVNGGVMNNNRWYELYDVKWGDELYLKPEKRANIW